ncbi:MAG TPA: hypothetical protein VMC07_02780 [Candidatus Omnitrophota bacterium]|nr:hypothetical protein [Candidatus Omnitrophota bacterium]
MNKRGIGFVILLFIAFLSVNFISASSVTCTIRAGTSCNSGEIRLMGLSDVTNAHGELPSQTTYPYSLCCTNPNPTLWNTSCSGTNKVLGLSSSTNAHAEIPSGIIYSNNVCYGYLTCVGSIDPCGINTAINYPINVINLSAPTDAHLGTGTGFPTAICCKDNSDIIGASCSITDASWEVSSVTAGLPVKMSLTGNGCTDPLGDGTAVNFTVYKESPTTLVTAVDGNYPYASWMPSSSGKYFFNATAVFSGNIFTSLSGHGNDELTVSAAPVGNPCQNIRVCEDYTKFWPNGNPDLACNNDAVLCNVSATDSRVNSNPPDGYSASCQWNTQTNTCNFTESYGTANTTKITCNNGFTLCTSSYGSYCASGDSCPSGETPLSDGDTICDSGEGCTNSVCGNGSQDSCIAGTTCKKTNSNQGLCYSSGSVVPQTACNTGYTLCQNSAGTFCYPYKTCPSGTNPATGSCSSASPNPSVTCLGTNAVCQNGVCYDSTISVGKCIYSYINTGDNCDDGFLTYSWTAQWTGTTGRPVSCQNGNATIECPAQIPLPLFTPINAITSILAIIAIYAIIALMKNQKKGKKKRI